MAEFNKTLQNIIISPSDQPNAGLTTVSMFWSLPSQGKGGMWLTRGNRSGKPLLHCHFVTIYHRLTDARSNRVLSARHPIQQRLLHEAGMSDGKAMNKRRLNSSWDILLLLLLLLPPPLITTVTKMNRVLLQQLGVSRLLNRASAFYHKKQPLFPPPEPSEFNPHPPLTTSIRQILILSTLLRLRLPSSLFPSVFLTETRYGFVSHHTCLITHPNNNNNNNNDNNNWNQRVTS